MRAILAACVAICVTLPAAATELATAPPPQAVPALAPPGELAMGVPQYPGAKYLGVTDDPRTGTSRFVFSTVDSKEQVTAYYVQQTGAQLQKGLSGPRQDYLSDPAQKSRKGKWALLVQPRKGLTYIHIDRYRQ